MLGKICAEITRIMSNVQVKANIIAEKFDVFINLMMLVLSKDSLGGVELRFDGSQAV